MHPSLSCCKNWLLEPTVAPYSRELSSDQRASGAQICPAEEIGVGREGSLWQPMTAWRRGGVQTSPFASVCYGLVGLFLLQCSFWNQADLGLQLDPHLCQLLSLSYPASSLLTGVPWASPLTNPSPKDSSLQLYFWELSLRNLPSTCTLTGVLGRTELSVLFLSR